MKRAKGVFKSSVSYAACISLVVSLTWSPVAYSYSSDRRAIEELKEQVAALTQLAREQQVLLNAMAPAITRMDETGVANVEKTVSKLKDDVAEAVDLASDETRKTLEQLLKHIDPSVIKDIDASTPKAVVDQRVGDLRRAAEEFRELRNTTNDAYANALQEAEQSCGATPDLQAVYTKIDQSACGLDGIFRNLSAVAPGLVGDGVQQSKQAAKEFLGQLAPDGKLNPNVLAVVPIQCLPDCVRNKDALQNAARDKAAVDAVQLQSQMMMNSMMMMALQSGNPYLIAAIMVLAILMQAFGDDGGGGGGDDNGEGDSSGSGQGSVGGENQGEQSRQNGGRNGDAGGGSETDIKVNVGADTEALGSWPKYTFTPRGRGRPFRIDFSNVQDDTGQLVTFGGPRVLISADPSTRRVVISCPNLDGTKDIYEYTVKAFSEGHPYRIVDIKGVPESGKN